MKKILLFLLFISSLCVAQINPNFSGNTYVASTGVLSVPKLTLTNLATATTGNILYYNAGVITVGAVPGGGITNTAAANEMMKSDGTNAVPSGVFSTTAGNLDFGTGLAGATRTLTAAGSASNVSIRLAAKGTSNVELNGAITLITSTKANGDLFEIGGTVNGGSAVLTSPTSTSMQWTVGNTTASPCTFTIAGFDRSNVTTSTHISIHGGDTAGSAVTSAGNLLLSPGVNSLDATKNGYIIISNLPTTCSGAPTGALANVSGVLTICP